MELFTRTHTGCAHSGLGLAMPKPGCWQPVQGPPEVCGYQQGELCIGQGEAAESRKDGMVTNARSNSRNVVGSNPGAGNIFTAKSPLKNTRCTLLWKLYIVFVREVQRINLSRVSMCQIYPKYTRKKNYAVLLYE